MSFEVRILFYYLFKCLILICLLFDEDIRGDGLRCEGRLRDASGRDAPFRLRQLGMLIFMRNQQLLLLDVQFGHRWPDSCILATNHVPAAVLHWCNANIRMRDVMLGRVGAL